MLKNSALADPREHLKLSEALDLARPRPEIPPAPPIWLACGFTPLHLNTYLRAHACRRFGAPSEIVNGVFGDLAGNLERAAMEPVSATAVLLEWADLDPRLGLRHSGGWAAAQCADIEIQVRGQLERLHASLERVAARSPVVLSGPTLSVPPIAHTGPAQDSGFELRLRAAVQSFLADVAAVRGVRVLSADRLALSSAPADRLDARMALATGFPYTLSHADALAALLVELLFPVTPKKALITDLDDTLWLGILGEIGVERVAWDLEKHAQHHGLYQQFLAALAERGVLVGIASKNDPDLVRQALARSDILIQASALFPIEVNWGPKSASIERILKAWNIGPSDVVFVDDSPMEVAEVNAAFPQMTCLVFPRGDADKLLDLLCRLRGLFGRQEILEEDRLRATSLRASEHFEVERKSVSEEDFLVQLGAEITLDFRKTTGDPRPLELVNKTNQFNLNGRRWTEGEWGALLARPESFLAVVSYSDKFGPLGRIAVMAGRQESGVARVLSWVMSCRAFSRRIEHHTLDRVFTALGADCLEFEYQPTERNGPLREFFARFFDPLPAAGPLTLNRGSFDARIPKLPHTIKEIFDGHERSSSSAVLLEGVP